MILLYPDAEFKRCKSESAALFRITIFPTEILLTYFRISSVIRHNYITSTMVPTLLKVLDRNLITLVPQYVIGSQEQNGTPRYMYHCMCAINTCTCMCAKLWTPQIGATCINFAHIHVPGGAILFLATNNILRYQSY